MAIDFPLSPAVDEVYSNGDRTWLWNGTAWQLESNGQQGEPGPAGSDGLSAYEVAVANGFTGTEEEWLETLVGPQGDIGPAGADGADGASAYEVAVADGFAGSEAEWLASLVGPEGPEGPQGEMGTQGIGIRFVGVVETLAELPVTAEQGDLYIVGEMDPNHGYVYDEALGEWVDAGPVQGPQGVQGSQGLQGEPGAAGADGKSAYEIAVDGGFTGTEEEWLQSLKGKQGAAGEQGLQGEAGVDGVDGKSAYEIAVDGGFVGTEEEWILSLKGEQGEAGEQGLQGEAGVDGISGEDGASAYEIAVEAGFAGTEAEWLASLVGPEGPEGPQGEMGSQGVGIRFVGVVETLAELPATAEQGDLYIVQELDPDHGYVYDEALGDWVDAGPVQGPQGVQGSQGLQGDPGEAGVDGKSAYELAVDGGFVGTEAEWIASLQGADGEMGTVGPEGPTVVSADAGNASVLGTDGFIYTPEGNKYSFSTTAPADPLAGDHWTDANSGRTYTFVDDGNSSQWVEL